MKVGIFSNTVGGSSPEEVAERARSLGAEAVQLRLDWPGLDLLSSRDDRARVRRAYEAAGVEIAALAGYSNLLHPNPERRRAARDYVARLIDVCAELGTRVVVTEAGTYDGESPWADHPHNSTQEAWGELVEATRVLVQRCERVGAVLAYEPYVNTVLSSAAKARGLVDEIGSPALGMVIDVAGLMTPETMPRNAEIAGEAHRLLRGHILLAHADDVRYEGREARWLPLGWGDLDAGAVLSGLAATGYDGAIIVEHLPESLVPEALAFCCEGWNVTMS